MIIVFGSINADLVTTVEKHPLPGETISGSDYLVLPGGKGANQALAARKAGGDVQMAGAVGKDGFAPIALENLKKFGVELGPTTQDSSTTGIAMIVIDAKGENTIVVTPGANADVQSSILSNKQFSMLVTQNEIDAGEITSAHKIAQNIGARVIHNAAPAHAIAKQDLENIDYLIVNETEALLVAKALGYKEDQPIDAAKFIQSLSGKSVIVTLGEKGAYAVDGESEYSVSSIPVDVKDTTGAGDAFVGAFAAAVDRGEGFETSVRIGAIAGSLACRMVGAQSSSPELQEIRKFLEQ